MTQHTRHILLSCICCHAVPDERAELPYWHPASEYHARYHAVLDAIARMNIDLMGIIYRAGKRFLLIEPDGFLRVVGCGRVCGFCFGSEANEARAAEHVTARRRFVAGC